MKELLDNTRNYNKGMTMNKQHKKIDIYFKNTYLHSTTWYKSCKDAKQGFIVRVNDAIRHKYNTYSTRELEAMKVIINNPSMVKAYFDKDASV